MYQTHVNNFNLILYVALIIDIVCEDTGIACGQCCESFSHGSLFLPVVYFPCFISSPFLLLFLPAKFYVMCLSQYDWQFYFLYGNVCCHKRNPRKTGGNENNIGLISEHVCMMKRTIWGKDSSVSKLPNDSFHTVFLSSCQEIMQYLFITDHILIGSSDNLIYKFTHYKGTLILHLLPKYCCFV